MRYIASNYIWSRERGFERHPVATVSDEGRIVALKLLENPDREPLTEFFSGVMVEGFAADERGAFDEMMHSSERGLDLLLRRHTSACGGVVVLSGLDYEKMELTPQSQILRVVR